MEELYFPQVDWIIDAIHERIIPLQGYKPVTVQTTMDLLRRNKHGV
jgi:2-oxoisovalerate dehydrogenase E1 component